MNASLAANRWVWLDLEMSGLEPERHRILEIATVVTDQTLKVVAEGPNLAIFQPDPILEDMDDWCTRTHGDSGLTERVRNSPLDLKQAEQKTLEFLSTHAEPGTAPLCGNSIWQDRRFLDRYMPDLARFFHYRQLDVSSLKLLVKAWLPERDEGFTKQGSHRALNDIYDSIAELKFYRSILMKGATPKNTAPGRN